MVSKHGRAHRSKQATRPLEVAREAAVVQQWFNLRWVKLLAACLMLLAAVALVYQPAWHGGFIWDDNAHVTRPELRSTEGLWRIWSDLGATQQYYPLLHSAFWVQHRLWGDAPLGYHLVNILLHVFSSVLVAMILLKLKVPGAWLAAAIFALHPVCVESVAWITELKNTLSAVFYLGAMLVYLHFDQRRKPGLYLGALGLFMLGLLSKTVTATLPGALLVVFWWQRGRPNWRRDVLPLLPFFLLGAAGGLLTAWVEYKLIGAEGAEFGLTVLQRCLLAGRVVWFYLSKLFWPTDLTFIYPRWEVNSGVWWQYLFPAGALGLLVALWVLRRTRRGPLAGMLYFVGTLFPVLGFFNVFPFIYSFVADHFQYLASLGVITVASAGISLWLQRWRLWGRWQGHAVCGALLLVLAILSRQQSLMYRDVETLYRTTIAENPRCWMAHNNLGIVVFKAGRIPEAIEHCQEALRLKPDFVEAHNNLGNALFKAGRTQEAIKHYEEALRLRPGFIQTHSNMGMLLLEAGRIPEAIRHYEEAVRLGPDIAQGHNNLGNALVKAGRVQEAIEEYEEALRLSPDSAQGCVNLGVALVQIGRIREAIEQYREALRLKPDNAEAHNNLGIALANSGRIPEAIEHCQEALRLRPDYTEAHSNLGIILAASGRVAEAIEHYQEALRLRPDFVEAHVNLGNALVRADRIPEAIECCQEALRLRPDSAEAHNNLGNALVKAGRVPEAVEHYQEALRLRPTFAEAQMNLRVARQMLLQRP